MSTDGRQHRMQVHFSSQTDMWATPVELFRRLDVEFHFNTDVCAVPENAKCERFFTPEQDGLKQDWTGTCFMNPPYGRDIGNWVKKAHDSSLKGTTVVCVLPARTDTRWWHHYVAKADEVRFLAGRLKFGDAATSAPFPSVIVVFRPRLTHQPALPIGAANTQQPLLFGDDNAAG